MNKEVFLIKIKSLNEAISAAENSKHKLKKQYVEECCPYKVGDKVKIVTPDWKGDFGIEFGYVERIKAYEDGRFLPDCAACKKDGTRHARNKVYVSFDSEITKVIDEDDMKLEDYTTEQLREELKRRAKIARENARKEGSNKPAYVFISGVVKRVENPDGPFSRRKWHIEVSKEFAAEHSIPQVYPYYLLGGAFTKDTAPKEGDKVRLKCRLTKALPKFTLTRARVIEIIKD